MTIDHRSSLLPDVGALTLDQKIAQVLAYAIYPSHPIGERPNRIERFVAEHGIGSIHFDTGGPTEIREWSAHLERLALDAVDIPILFGADAEQGLPHSFACGTELPWQLAMGAASDLELVREAGAIVGREARALGIDMVYGPCADVNSNPDNRLLISRAFGCDPERVSAQVRAYVEGLQSAGCMATLKHFPGHGGAVEDSHLQLAYDRSSRETVEATHLPPFRAGIEAGAMAVMTGHVVLPHVDPELPATLSRVLLTDILRGQLGFEGLVITDSLNMHAMKRDMPGGRARLPVLALKAGADLVLHPSSLGRARTEIAEAVCSGELPESTLDVAAARVLQAKRRVLAWRAAASEVSGDSVLGAPEHIAVAQRIADRAVTLAPGDTLRPLDSRPHTLVVLLDDLGKPVEVPPIFSDHLLEALPGSRTLVLRGEEPETFDQVREALSATSDPIVLAIQCPMVWYRGRTLLSDELTHRLAELLDAERVVATVVFGSPYILPTVPGAARLCAYGPSAPSQRAAAKVLLGRLPPGRGLPIA